MFSQKRIDGYACKFIAVNKKEIPTTNENLERSFKECLIPAPVEAYEEIKIRVEEFRNDPNFRELVEE